MNRDKPASTAEILAELARVRHLLDKDENGEKEENAPAEARPAPEGDAKDEQPPLLTDTAEPHLLPAAASPAKPVETTALSSGTPSSDASSSGQSLFDTEPQPPSAAEEGPQAGDEEALDALLEHILNREMPRIRLEIKRMLRDELRMYRLLK